MSVKVISAGMLSTVQDGGRRGCAALGFNPSGCMDLRSYRTANALVGNFADEAVIEMTVLGGSFEFLDDGFFALTGADMQPLLNGEPMSMYKSVFAKKGDELSIKAAKSGMRCYLALHGGIDVPKILGSRSTNLKCALGGFCGRKLKAGDVLPVKELPDGFNKSPRIAPREDFSADKITVRVILGPQDDYFTEKGIKTFLSSPYTVGNESDRMGCRLSGEKIEYKQSTDIVSDGIAFGSVQIPGSGAPIIMLADRQTTGGYAKIATVISVDLPLIAQAKPGTEIRFEEISRSEAEKELKRETKALNKLIINY